MDTTGGPSIIIDQNGERGVIRGLDVQTQHYRVEHDGHEFLVPADLLSPIGQSYFSLPGSFTLLARQTGVDDTETLTIPVVEERLVVDKRAVETGVVRVHVTINEREVLVDEPLIEDRVVVEHVPVNRAIDQPAVARVEGDTTIIPVMKEVLMVRKQLILVEEIRLTTHREEVHRPQRILLRSEEAHVERLEDKSSSIENQPEHVVKMEIENENDSWSV